MAKAKTKLENGSPVHPAAPFGPHAVRMFEEAVAETVIRRRATKTSEILVNAGLLYDRQAGVDGFMIEVFDFSARLEAYEEYCAYLDYVDAQEAAKPPVP